MIFDRHTMASIASRARALSNEVGALAQTKKGRPKKRDMDLARDLRRFSKDTKALICKSKPEGEQG